jgi:hypothetical protein
MHIAWFLFGLASGGVYHATRVTTRAVRSYRTLSAFPVPRRAIGSLLSAALSVRSPCPAVSRRRISVKPGLSSPRFPQRQSKQQPSDFLDRADYDLF